MRVVTDPEFGERRDALAQDWPLFMEAALPEAAWSPIPNIGQAAVRFAELWSINALILTGGDNIGVTPLRDETERALLENFLKNNYPVLGICRGMQFIQTHLGGPIEPCPPADHSGAVHRVEFVQGVGEAVGQGASVEVNSFHTFGIRREALASPLDCIAQHNGWAEAARCSDARVLALMWHPEREGAPKDVDRRLVRHHFGADEHSKIQTARRP